jgi:hypothetical protein
MQPSKSTPLQTHNIVIFELNINSLEAKSPVMMGRLHLFASLIMV